MTSSRNSINNLIVVAALAVAATLPIAVRGIPGGNDAVQHYEFAQQVNDAIREGHLFPSFAGNSNNGFGDTGLRVYPPLAYYVLAVAFAISGSWFCASVLVFFLVFFAGGVGIFLWVRELAGEPGALIAAAVFSFAPYHLNQIYNNFLFAEFAASAILPFCFLFVFRVCSRGKLLDCVGMAAFCALLIITHLPTTVLGSGALFLYSLLAARNNFLTSLPKLAASVFGAAVLSAFYWIRVVTESGFIRHSRPEYFDGIWSFKENFLLSPSRLADPSTDILSLWLGDLMWVAMLLICVPTIVFLAKERKRLPGHLLPLTAIAAIALFMATPLSTPVWERLPLLHKVQFPWRWLGIASVVGAAVASFGLRQAGRRLDESRDPVLQACLGALLLFFVVLSAFIVKAPNFTSASEFEQVARTFSRGETFEGWWPVGANRAAFGRKERISASGREVEETIWSQQRRTFRIGAGQPTDLIVSTFYYPYWKATLNGIPASVTSDDLGLISIPVGSEASIVDLRFEEPPWVRWCAGISALGWALALGFVVFFRKTASNVELETN